MLAVQWFPAEFFFFNYINVLSYLPCYFLWKGTSPIFNFILTVYKWFLCWAHQAFYRTQLSNLLIQHLDNPLSKIPHCLPSSPLDPLHCVLTVRVLCWAPFSFSANSHILIRVWLMNPEVPSTVQVGVMKFSFWSCSCHGLWSVWSLSWTKQGWHLPVALVSK